MMLVRLGNFLFGYRNFIFPAAFLLVFLPGPRIFVDPAVALLAGTVLALVGQCLRALTIGLEYIIRGGKDRRVYAEGLVTDGLFAHTRNPMYLGNLLILSGVALAANSWTCLATAVPLAFLVYVAIVAAEENFLRGKFAEGYEQYAAAVPRWGIILKGLSARVAGMRFRWRRLLVKEYGTTTAWILALTVIGWLSQDDEHVRAHYPYWRGMLLSVAAVTACGWGVARWVKKSRLIVAD